MAVHTSIRVCTVGDEAALSLVAQASFLEAFADILDGKDLLAHCATQHSVSVYRSWLESESTTIWIAETSPGGAPVGYLVLTAPNLPIADPRPDDLEIKRVYLLHAFQGAGIGRRLMQATLADAKVRRCSRLLLGVYSQNKNAIGFYQKLGFRNIGERKFQVGFHVYNDLVLALEVSPQTSFDVHK